MDTAKKTIFGNYLVASFIRVFIFTRKTLHYSTLVLQSDNISAKRIDPFLLSVYTTQSQMASPAVISVSKIKASDIQFTEPRKNKNGSVSIGFKYNKQNVQFRVPSVSFPGGLQRKENPNKDGSVTVSYTLSASMAGGDPYGAEHSADPSETAKMYNFMYDFQELIISTAVEQSLKWFGKKRSEDSIRDSFNKFISLSVDKTDNGWVPNGKYPPSLRMKLPVYDGKIAMEVIDSDDNDVPLSLDNLENIFAKGTSAKMVLQAQIYMVGQAFGVTWKPSYAQVIQRKKASARDYFKADEDDVEVDEEEQNEEEIEEVELQIPVANIPTSIPDEPASSDAKPARRRKVA